MRAIIMPASSIPMMRGSPILLHAAAHNRPPKKIIAKEETIFLPLSQETKKANAPADLQKSSAKKRFRLPEGELHSLF